MLMHNLSFTLFLPSFLCGNFITISSQIYILDKKITLTEIRYLLVINLSTALGIEKLQKSHN